MRTAAGLAILLLAATPALGLRFERLGPGHFAVGHETEGPRSITVGYEKVASICKAAGGAFFEVIRQTDEILEFRTYPETADGRRSCEEWARPRHLKWAKRDLAAIDARAQKRLAKTKPATP